MCLGTAEATESRLDACEADIWRDATVLSDADGTLVALETVDEALRRLAV